jgi:SAM-dependent methyltransferase
MLRYRAAALALKFFSMSSSTRRMYRALGNRTARPRTSFEIEGYARNAAWLAGLVRENKTVVNRAAEIGTGWFHFYGVALSLTGIPEIDLYDVWDNRQFENTKSAFANFEPHLSALALPETELAAAQQKLNAVAAAERWNDMYSALGLSYSLKPLRLRNYDLVFSMDVLEHVEKGALPSLIRSMYDALAPGGISVNLIGLDDHLNHYDSKSSQKQFLAYREWQWQLMFENKIQHFNRVGCSEFRSLFAEAGFEEISCRSQVAEDALDNIGVAPQFRSFAREDLLATRASFADRKPSR